MSTIPPIADAIRLLRADLALHLDEVEFLAGRWDEWSEQEVTTIRALLHDLAHVVRQLWREHNTLLEGECALCSLPWPCPVVTTVHALVKDPEREFVQLANAAQPIIDTEYVT